MDFLPWLWLGLNITSIIVLSFYSMMEMACVSFNKVRLQYYVSNGNTRAIRLNNLLQHPAHLFGTTLIGVNIAMFFGSEFARQFHASIGWSPDLAPLSQVVLVVIFGELAPMFAARRYAENTALLGITPLYLSSILMKPFLWCIHLITQFTHKIIGSQDENPNIFITQEELQKILEEQDEDQSDIAPKEDFNTIVSNIFSLRTQKAEQVMTPIKQVVMIPSTSTIAEMRQALQTTTQVYLPVFHQKTANIIGIAFPRDLVRQPDHRRVRDEARQPWFITQHTEILQILSQFKRNNQTVAAVINDKGQAIGILTLEDIVDKIFGETHLTPPLKPQDQTPFIDRTFPGDMKIAEFNQLYYVQLESHGAETLEDLMIKVLGHHPEPGESIYLPPFELTVKEASILEIQTIGIKTKAI